MKRSSFRRKSERQRKFDEELEEITPDLFARAENRCEVGVDAICLGAAHLHRHHRRSRRIRRDGKANALSNLLLTCAACHALIHHDRRWALDNGYIIKTSADPDLVEVTPNGRWMP